MQAPPASVQAPSASAKASRFKTGLGSGWQARAQLTSQEAKKKNRQNKRGGNQENKRDRQLGAEPAAAPSANTPTVYDEKNGTARMTPVECLLQFLVFLGIFRDASWSIGRGMSYKAYRPFTTMYESGQWWLVMDRLAAELVGTLDAFRI